MRVEVAYALPEHQRLIALELPQPVTVRLAIERSGILEEFPEIDLAVNKVGVFSQIADLDDPLLEGDRVEIYRPLIADPKASRRQRAEKKKRAEAEQKKSGEDG